MEYYKNQLDDHDQKVYEMLLIGMKKRKSNISIPLPHSDFCKIVEFIEMDHPEIFYVEFNRTRYRQSSFSIQYECHYLYTKNEVQTFQKEMEDWRQYFIKRQPPNLSVPQLYLWLHDCITYNTTYGNFEKKESYNLRGLIHDHVSVCEGISKAYKYLCAAFPQL